MRQCASTAHSITLSYLKLATVAWRAWSTLIRSSIHGSGAFLRAERCWICIALAIALSSPRSSLSQRGSPLPSGRTGPRYPRQPRLEASAFFGAFVLGNPSLIEPRLAKLFDQWELGRDGLREPCPQQNDISWILFLPEPTYSPIPTPYVAAVAALR